MLIVLLPLPDARIVSTMHPACQSTVLLLLSYSVHFGLSYANDRLITVLPLADANTMYSMQRVCHTWHTLAVG